MNQVDKSGLHYLRVKIKSLAEEARIIRHEEQRCHSDFRSGLYMHRIDVVRPECRAALLAYAFLRGKPSPETKSYPSWNRTKAYSRARDLVKKYGTGDKLKEWDKLKGAGW